MSALSRRRGLPNLVGWVDTFAEHDDRSQIRCGQGDLGQHESVPGWLDHHSLILTHTCVSISSTQSSTGVLAGVSHIIRLRTGFRD